MADAKRTRRAGRGSTGKRERALYLRDSTLWLWRDTARRARLLAYRPGDATADDVLRNAVRLLRRAQDRDARRRRIDLSPPPDPNEPPETPVFRGPVRPPNY